MQKKAVIKELKYFHPEHILNAWPPELPLLFLGGNSTYAILPICFYEANFEQVAKQPLEADPRGQNEDKQLPFVSGYVGLISYDDYSTEKNLFPQTRPSRIFRVNKALVFDQQNQQLFLCEGEAPFASKAHHNSHDASEFLYRFQKQVHSGLSQGKVTEQLRIKAYRSAEDYLRMCKQAISDIRKGRYYQINLLRYFELEGVYNPRDLIPRFTEQSGPFGALFFLKDLSLISFSPERFIQLSPEGGCLSARTFPIKGTIGRHQDQDLDTKALNWLKNSQKDHQELHMIVDLMRNDLNKISLRGSVQVNNAAAIKSFKQVHHLEASISSRLRPNLSLSDFFSCLAPGGSITGAPKVEVMKAISESEGRNRGYFMGCAFYWDDSGSLDSSILIRTLASKHGTTDHWEYAAGSGIVLKSTPASELEEIDSKCRVVTR